MATASVPDIADDVVRRGIKRTLPCVLTDREFTEVARTRATKEALQDQLEADLAKEKKKRLDQIGELADEVEKMKRELHTGEQDRTVSCNEVFRRAEDGTGWIHTIRMDTLGEVERRPATPSETQRYLPGIEGVPTAPMSLIDQAIAAQANEEDEPEPSFPELDDDDAVPPEPDDALDGLPPALDDEGPEDDGLDGLPAEPEVSAPAAAEPRRTGKARSAKGKSNGKKGKGK